MTDKQFKTWADLVGYVDENIIEELEAQTRETGLIRDYGRESRRTPGDLLDASLCWADTKQGHDYWSNICRKLRNDYGRS